MIGDPATVRPGRLVRYADAQGVEVRMIVYEAHATDGPRICDLKVRDSAEPAKGTWRLWP